MNTRTILLGAAAYLLVTFPLAILWHIVLFERQYTEFRYIEGEPSFVLGFVTILIQGVVLSVMYPLMRMAGSDFVRGMKFALLIGLFFWTSHVLAFIAKQEIPDAPGFIVMETIYLALQFGIFGFLISRIHRAGPAEKNL